MLAARLARTGVGRAIMGQAATGTEQDFYWPAASVVNPTIVCRVLTGMSSAAILADPVLSVHIATNSTAGAFAFTPPTGGSKTWRTRTTRCCRALNSITAR
jgi:hypothetical protein